MEQTIYNPYLPTFEYVPDGEPHVFDGRIYLYGSHDRFHGADFCLNDYVSYSADVHDLTNWRHEGVIYRKDQDPRNQDRAAGLPERVLKQAIEPIRPEDINPQGVHAMWAPDVVRGLDGRYYLYYCLDVLPEIAVAVCDSPAGRYEFLGFVRHADGTPLGRRANDLVQFDPGVFIDDDGAVYLYSGNAPREKTRWDGHASQVMRLEEDMLTLKTEPKKLLPDITESEGTDYEGHEFFEASSIRKINGMYYFVYSSVRSHELCYAVSDRPDGAYRFGGTLVDIGDVFLDGREEKDAVNCLGNTHGGIEKAGDRWFVFYHRQTNRTNYSRQACAEEIFFDEKGHIRQAEVTSRGLNDGPLPARGSYPASICCQLTAKSGAVMSSPSAMKMDYPYLTQDGSDLEPTPERIEEDRRVPVQYVANLQDESVVGYKYFRFDRVSGIGLEIRGEAGGEIEIRMSRDGECIARIPVDIHTQEWTNVSAPAAVPDGISALYLIFRGRGRLDMRRLVFTDER